MLLGLQGRVADKAHQASSYAYLLELDRAGWAWQWLRRNPDFASACPPSAQLLKTSASIVVPVDALDADLLRWGLHYGGG